MGRGIKITHKNFVSSLLTTSKARQCDPELVAPLRHFLPYVSSNSWANFWFYHSFPWTCLGVAQSMLLMLGWCAGAARILCSAYPLTLHSNHLGPRHVRAQVGQWNISLAWLAVAEDIYGCFSASSTCSAEELEYLVGSDLFLRVIWLSIRWFFQICVQLQHYKTT